MEHDSPNTTEPGEGGDGGNGVKDTFNHPLKNENPCDYVTIKNNRYVPRHFGRRRTSRLVRGLGNV